MLLSVLFVLVVSVVSVDIVAELLVASDPYAVEAAVISVSVLVSPSVEVMESIVQGEGVDQV